mmetsp:Transcript_19480/g.47167  ORF Transcript_19480/g.47167 Transcript_19480/m.47167 type:complete len:239 (-) Transcript_19480:206-922(-)
MTLASPVSSSPYVWSISSLSSSSICDTSASRLAQTVRFVRESPPRLASMSWTACVCALPCNSCSETLQRSISGFPVSRPSPRNAAASSSSIITSRAGMPLSRSLMSLSASSASCAASCASFAPVFWRFLPRVWRSASSSSVSIMSKSRTGSTDPSTCSTPGSSKHLRSCTMTETWRMFPRNLFPSPAPSLAPFTSPAMSTNSSWAPMILADLAASASTASRRSGIATRPMLGSMVQNG